jgi:beta-xylosidase
MPGDHPDPSVVKIGDTYWASATTSNWMPVFPLLKSKDLLEWKKAGHVFNKLPTWADYYFWAPEVTYDKGRVYVFYSAHKKGGNLCIAVASSDKPEGPYKDHGPLMCEEAGSIDAFPMRDENGKLYIIWKEDGNSVKKPTPIWAMEMNEERTKLIGEKKQLFKNDLEWEKNLVEGVSIIKHNDYFYAFYAAAGCCGAGCDYVTAVARSKKLLGPWEKYEKNPLLKDNKSWLCPGHGTPVEKDGRYYFLYHGYDKRTRPYTGREGLLNEFRFTDDGWIEFLNDPFLDTMNKQVINDEFNGRSIGLDWQWSVFQNVSRKLVNGELVLGSLPTASFIGQSTQSGNYTATTVINNAKTSGAAGIAAIGDDENMISCIYSKGKLAVVETRKGKITELYSKTIGIRKRISLRMRAEDSKHFSFSYSVDGKKFIPVNDQSVDSGFLPPWDRAVRAGLISKGSVGKVAVFGSFEMESGL